MAPDKEGRSSEGEKKSFWTTLPGLITAIATLLTAITGAYLAFHDIGPNGDGNGKLTITPTIPPTTVITTIPTTVTTTNPVTETPTISPTAGVTYRTLSIGPGVNPDTLQPGEATEVWVMVHNQYSEDIQNAAVRFEAIDGTFSSGERIITGITDEGGVFVDQWRAPPDDGIRGKQFKIDIQVSYPGSPTARDYVIVKIAS